MNSMRKIHITALAMVAAGTVLCPTEAQAEAILSARCSNDSLPPAVALQRLEWARACGASVNIVSPTTPKVGAGAWAELTGVSSANGVPLWDYGETLDFVGKNSFSGDSGNGINTIFTQMQYKTGPITATTVAGGFQKWTMPTVLARPNYPTFGDRDDINFAVQLFPNPNYALLDCKLYKDANATQVATTTTTGFYVNGYCTSSCYTPEQKIRFAGGDEKILDALTALRSDVTTLTPSSTLQNIKLKTDDVFSYTREIHDSTHVIFEIRTASGGELRVTDKHPVLEGNGKIVEARTLKVGDKLIKPDGSVDPITSVTRTTHFGKVYNLKPKSTNRVSNLLIAQGYLVGSSRYQNEDVDYMNRIIMGRSVPKELLPH